MALARPTRPAQMLGSMAYRRRIARIMSQLTYDAATRTTSLRCCRRFVSSSSSAAAAPPVRLALLGCGGVAEAHLNAAAKFKVPVQVTAAIDLDPARVDVVAGIAATLSEQGGVVPAGFRTIDACLAAVGSNVDVVAIFLPHDSHEEAAIQMLATDKHVMLEKPMAPTVAECDRIMTAAESHSGVFMLAENSSFWPEVTRAKQLLDDGAIGELVTARSHYYEALNSSPFADEAEWLGWRKNLAICGGGIVLDGGQHWLRPLREFMGEVEAVVAVTQRPFDVIEGESLCHALLRFESGKVASYQATVLSKTARMAHSEDPFFRLIGQNGDITIAGTSLHGKGSVKLFTNECPEGKEMMDTSPDAPLGCEYIRPQNSSHEQPNHTGTVHFPAQ